MPASARISRVISFIHIAQDGVDALMLVLDPPAVSVSCDPLGNALSVPVNFRAYVRRGALNESGWSFSVVPNTCVASIDASTGEGKITDIMPDYDSASVRVTAKKGAETLTATLSVAKSKQGKQGPEGKTGGGGAYVPTPMRWMDYPDDYVFQSGGQGEERKDVVLANNPNPNGTYNAYECIATHPKSKEDGYLEGNSDYQQANWSPADAYWRKGSSYRLISTEIILARNAFIGLGSGNRLNILDLKGNIVGAASSIDCAPVVDGRLIPWFMGGLLGASGSFTQNPLMAVDSEGIIYSGGLSGRHIEINPGDGSIRVFDDNGALCAIHSGRTLSTSEITGALTSVTNSNISITSQSAYASRSSSQILSGLSSPASAPGSLKVKVPKMKLQAIAGTFGTDHMGFQVIPSARVSLYLDVTIGKDVMSVFIGSAMATASSTVEGDVQAVSNVETQAFERSFNVPASQGYGIALRYEFVIENAAGVAATGSASFETSEKFGYEFYKTSCMTEYGANGIIISTGSDNYFYALFDSAGKLHIKAVSDGKQVFSS